MLTDTVAERGKQDEGGQRKESADWIRSATLNAPFSGVYPRSVRAWRRTSRRCGIASPAEELVAIEEVLAPEV